MHTAKQQARSHLSTTHGGSTSVAQLCRVWRSRLAVVAARPVAAARPQWQPPPPGLGRRRSSAAGAAAGDDEAAGPQQEPIHIPSRPQALDDVASDAGAAVAEGGADDGEVEDDGLVAPAVSRQPRLTPKERAQRRAESEQMAREKKLVQVQVRAAAARARQLLGAA